MSTEPMVSTVLQAKLAALNAAAPNAVPHLTDYQPPDAPSFQVNSQPFANFPAPGAGPVTMLTYTAPPGLLAVLKYMAIVAVGGGFIDGSGNVVWRCAINGNFIDGLDTITAHLGNFDTPNPVQIVLTQNDVFTITVEVPAGQPPMPPGATTGARIQGWTYPIGKAVMS